MAGEVLFKLGHLGAHHKGAIALLRVVGKIILMVGLGRVVVLKRAHLGDDGPRVGAGLRELSDQRTRLGCLLGRGEVDAAAVLRSMVAELRVFTVGSMFIQNTSTSFS